MIQAVCKYSQRKGLCPVDGFLSRCSVRKDARKFWHFREPTPVVLLFDLDRQRHR